MTTNKINNKVISEVIQITRKGHWDGCGIMWLSNG